MLFLYPFPNQSYPLHFFKLIQDNSNVHTFYDHQSVSCTRFLDCIKISELQIGSKMNFYCILHSKGEKTQGFSTKTMKHWSKSSCFVLDSSITHAPFEINCWNQWERITDDLEIGDVLYFHQCGIEWNTFQSKKIGSLTLDSRVFILHRLCSLDPIPLGNFKNILIALYS